jgi:hypothetical protein
LVTMPLFKKGKDAAQSVKPKRRSEFDMSGVHAPDLIRIYMKDGSYR